MDPKIPRVGAPGATRHDRVRDPTFTSSAEWIKPKQTALNPIRCPRIPPPLLKPHGEVVVEIDKITAFSTDGCELFFCILQVEIGDLKKRIPMQTNHPSGEILEFNRVLDVPTFAKLSVFDTLNPTIACGVARVPLEIVEGDLDGSSVIHRMGKGNVIVRAIFRAAANLQLTPTPRSISPSSARSSPRTKKRRVKSPTAPKEASESPPQTPQRLKGSDKLPPTGRAGARASIGDIASIAPRAQQAGSGRRATLGFGEAAQQVAVNKEEWVKLRRQDFLDLRTLVKPLAAVEKLCQAVMHMLAGVDTVVDLDKYGQPLDTSWKSCQRMLVNPELLDALLHFHKLQDQGMVPKRNMDIAQRLCATVGPELDVEMMMKRCFSAAGLCDWVNKTIHRYYVHCLPKQEDTARERQQEDLRNDIQDLVLDPETVELVEERDNQDVIVGKATDPALLEGALLALARARRIADYLAETGMDDLLAVVRPQLVVIEAVRAAAYLLTQRKRHMSWAVLRDVLAEDMGAKMRLFDPRVEQIPDWVVSVIDTTVDRGVVVYLDVQQHSQTAALLWDWVCHTLQSFKLCMAHRQRYRLADLPSQFPDNYLPLVLV